MMNSQVRMVCWYVIEASTLFSLMETNDRVGETRHFARVQPFLLGAILFYLIAFILIARQMTTEGVPWWKVWHRYDPFTAIMVLASTAVGAYFTAIYGGFSGRFTVSDDVYATIRIAMWVAGFVGVPIALELAIAAVQARMGNRKKRLVIYDTPERETK